MTDLRMEPPHSLHEAEGPDAASSALTLDETVVLKACNVFSMTARDGSVPSGHRHPLGLWMNDCRFLCSHVLRLAGAPPQLLVASSPQGSTAIHELTNRALRLESGQPLGVHALRIRLERVLIEDGAMEETISVRSYERAPLQVALDIALAADFAPMLAIRGIASAGTVAPVASRPAGAGLRFETAGRDGVVRATTVTGDPPPDAAGEGGLRFDLALERGSGAEVRIRYELHEGAAPPAAPRRAARGAPRRPAPVGRETPDDSAWLQGLTTIHSDDELFNRVLRRSVLDVGMLRSRIGTHDYYAAGVPWFATLFGRDSLTVAMQLLALDPGPAEGTLRLLGALIGRHADAWRDEQPGKVLHELRVGEPAALELTPLARYYGTVDATPLYLCLLCEHAEWTGDLALFRALRGEIDAMLGWIDGPGDANGDGLLDYAPGTPQGLRNQGWKDSDDGIQDEDGVPLEPPITLIEPQAYVLRAKQKLARLFEEDGSWERGRRLREEAAQLRGRLEAFWLPDRGFYSMGFGADGRPSRALASNQGHLLWALGMPPERARRVRDALMGADMFSGWGIRTLSSDESGYNPVGYHTGTVWPHDSALAAAGLRAYQLDGDFIAIFEGLLEAAATTEGYRLPELFAGFSRADFDVTVPYPVACRPQAWAAGSIPYMVKVGLGLNPDGLERRLRIRRPSLPRWVSQVQVRNMRVGGSSVDLRFERATGSEHVVLADAAIRGDVEVTLEISGDGTFS